MTPLHHDLARLLHRHGWDRRTETPTSVLAAYLVAVLADFAHSMTGLDVLDARPPLPDPAACP